MVVKHVGSKNVDLSHAVLVEMKQVQFTCRFFYLKVLVTRLVHPGK